MKSRAAATWNGGLGDGSGVARLATGVGGDLPVSWAARTVEAGGKTSPEELIAAAHAACYSMALSHELGEAGFPPEQLEASAVCSFERQEGGWGITSMHLSVRGSVPGITPEDFAKLAAAAKDGCPVSKALAGNVAVSLDDATLV
jgi:osmotically inducible protein OsmC